MTAIGPRGEVVPQGRTRTKSTFMRGSHIGRPQGLSIRRFAFGCNRKAPSTPRCFRVLSHEHCDANEIFYIRPAASRVPDLAQKVDTSLYPGIEWYVKSAIEAEEWFTSGLDSPIWMRIWGEWSKAQNAVIYGEKGATEALEEMNRVTQDQLDSLLQA